MKNKFCLIILFAFAYQINFAQQFKAGITAGLVASDIDGADQIDGDNDFHKVGFTVGGLVNTQISKNCTAQMEINYIRKGSSNPPDSLNMGYYKISLSYIEIPILIRRKINFTIRKKPVDRFELEGGASFGRLIQHVATGSNNYILPSNDQYYNKYDVSLLAGVNYRISKNIYFNLRYTNSVIPAIKRNTPNWNFITYTFNRGNNLVFQFSFKFILNAQKDESVPKPVDVSSEDN